MSRPSALIALVLTSLAAVAGCSVGGSERVGGAPAADVVELTLLTPGTSQEAIPFADEVAKLSDGSLRIRFVSGAHTDLDYDAATIRDIQDGRADLGLAGSRAWDDFGVPAPTALGAPFLVDSYPLQERLFTSRVVDTALQGLDRAGVVGIGIVPGPIRRPFGLSGPLAAPDDFAGLVVGTQQSSVADATMRALGAKSLRLPMNITPDLLTDLDGVEFQVAGIEGNRLDVPGSHLMANVDLWPRPLVIFAGAAAYHRLTAAQQQVLRAAAQRSAGAESTTESGLEAEAAGNLCRKGNTVFDVASPEQLRALRRAVEPVYAELERDPEARAVIRAVQQAKDQMSEPSAVLGACTPVPDAKGDGEPTEVDGVWTMDTVEKDAPPDYLDENWGHWVFVLDRGRFAITQENRTSCTWGYGTYAVKGSRMAWIFLDGGGIAPNNATNRPGEYFVFDFSTFRDTLTLEPVEGETSPVNFRAHPWRLVSDDPSTDHFSTRCPPPPDALVG
jgi:TRAP-type C4-dicarboxylate transport system substrate-binding protein